MSVAPKLLGCRVNMTYFVMTQSENERRISWKHPFECDGCSSYFFGTES